MKKILLVCLFISIGIIPYSLHVNAVTQQPPSGNVTIENIWAYQSLYENGDQLYLAELSIPDPPSVDLTASQTFVLNLMNGSTILGATTPITNPYGNTRGQGGYGLSCVGIYFSALDVVDNGMVWNSTNYTMQLLTSDFSSATWNGTPPAPTPLVSIPNWYDTSKSYARGQLQTRIVSLAGIFKSSWGTTATFISSGLLTVDGETYFMAAIPNLRLLCPDIFEAQVSPITYYKRVALSVTYALTLRSQWIGTWLDLTTMAADFGIDAIWFYAGLWALALLAACVGFIGFTSSNEGLSFVVGLMVIVGGLVGFLPWSCAVLATVVAGIDIWWAGFYKRSSS
ncbi:hypothetical protein M0R04_08190 [Candidatus Dojkabacteria bacterium]|jgi:hypothetical protein|nr:hypothetical protein [Candidatus Dojkabacteria bacterium]